MFLIINIFNMIIFVKMTKFLILNFNIQKNPFFLIEFYIEKLICTIKIYQERQ